jgi:capsular polysaccharide transport system permease protein
MQRSRAGGAPVLDILLAALLRDMRTRFGRSYASYLLAIIWPMSHLTIAFTMYIFGHKVAPIGDDPSIFAFTGLVPYIMCLYPARFTAWTVMQNKPLLNFIVVKPIHLVVARALLESLSAILALSLFVLGLSVFNMATLPDDIYLVAETIAAILFFSVSFGFFCIFLVSLHVNFGTLFVVFSILGLYLSSGAVVPLTSTSAYVQNLLSYNPLFEAVGLMRCAYFSAYDASNYSLSYIYFLGLVFTMLGLLSERLFRGVMI